MTYRGAILQVLIYAPLLAAAAIAAGAPLPLDATLDLSQRYTLAAYVGAHGASLGIAYYAAWSIREFKSEFSQIGVMLLIPVAGLNFLSLAFVDVATVARAAFDLPAAPLFWGILGLLILRRILLFTARLVRKIFGFSVPIEKKQVVRSSSDVEMSWIGIGAAALSIPYLFGLMEYVRLSTKVEAQSLRYALFNDIAYPDDRFLVSSNSLFQGGPVLLAMAVPTVLLLAYMVIDKLFLAKPTANAEQQARQ